MSRIQALVDFEVQDETRNVKETTAMAEEAPHKTNAELKEDGDTLKVASYFYRRSMNVFLAAPNYNHPRAVFKRYRLLDKTIIRTFSNRCNLWEWNRDTLMLVIQNEIDAYGNII
jgi:hypothetical protein